VVVGSENLDSADNQQERLSSEEARRWFLAGFVEGEGRVTVSIERHGGNPFGLYIQPEFFVYQHRVRRELLEMAQEYFGAGRIRPKPGNPDVLVYSVMSRPVIRERVLPFLSACGRFSARVADYEKFAAVVRLLDAGLHRDPWGMSLIVEIAYSMNANGKQRRVPIADILGRIPRGHMPDALEPERRYGPTSVATRRARRNSNDLATQLDLELGSNTSA